MNTMLGKTEFSTEEVAEEQRLLRSYKQSEAISWAEIARRVDVPEGTISQWATGAYKGDNVRIAAAVHRFFLTEQARQEAELDAPIVPSFVLTKTAQRVTSQLRWAQRGNLTVYVGGSGIGKTAALEQFRDTNPNFWLVTGSPFVKSPLGIVAALLRVTGPERPVSAGSVYPYMRELEGRISGRRHGVICVDEAQHLDADALEALRALHDATGCGMALIGNEQVLSRIEGGKREARFAQLYSRVSMRHAQNLPLEADIDMLLDAWLVESPKERAYCRGIALKPGGLRSMTKTLEMATLLAREAGEERGLELIRAAAAQLATQVTL